MGVGIRKAVLLVVAAAVTLAAPSVAGAAFPGTNGKIVFTTAPFCDFDSDARMYTVEPDGGGLQELTWGCEPEWSPNGRKLVMWRGTENISEVPQVTYVHAARPGERDLGPLGSDATWSPDMSAIAYAGGGIEIVRFNGTGSVLSPNTCDTEPAWSPAGDLVAFARTCGPQPGIYVIGIDGAGETFVTAGRNPDWSPDGTNLAFSDTRDGNSEIYTVPVASPGTVQRVTNHSSKDDSPAWSPDGNEIVFSSKRDQPGMFSSENDLYVWDGSTTRRITTNQFAFDPDWQARPTTPEPTEGGFVRPKGATPLRVPLVPAYKRCTAPNREHGPPLAFGSCSPPVESSARVSLGTADAHSGLATEGVGHVRLDVLPGAPGGADDTDVRIALDVRNVICTGATTCSGRDYTGQLVLTLGYRLTDRNNDVAPGGGADGGTTEDFSHSGLVFCTATADTTLGSACSVSTSADAMTPGSAKERMRQIMALDTVKVFDGQQVPAALFLTQGVFVP